MFSYGLAVAVHCLVLPLKAGFKHTIPDVRAGGSVGGAIGSSIAWLAVLSYVMVFCCENIGEILKIPSAVVGLTLGAVGTSLPNLVASMVVAKQGFGAMAVSNALGSNVFNIVIALGVPWCLYPLVYGTPYATMEDTGVMVQVLFLFVVLAIYCAVLALNNLQLPQPAQYVLVATWLGGLTFAIAHPGWINQLEAWILPTVLAIFGRPAP